MIGELKTPVLTVEDGATLKGFLQIGPNQPATPNAIPKEAVAKV